MITDNDDSNHQHDRTNHGYFLILIVMFMILTIFNNDHDDRSKFRSQTSDNMER